MLKYRWYLNIGIQTPKFAEKYSNLQLITQKSHDYKTPAKFQEHNNLITGLIDYTKELRNSSANHRLLVEGSDRILHCCPPHTNLKPVCNSDREISCIECFWIVNKKMQLKMIEQTSEIQGTPKSWPERAGGPKSSAAPTPRMMLRRNEEVRKWGILCDIYAHRRWLTHVASAIYCSVI